MTAAGEAEDGWDGAVVGSWDARRAAMPTASASDAISAAVIAVGGTAAMCRRRPRKIA